MPDYTLADNPDSLAPAFDRLDLAGVDTEFMREKTYFSELCLVQVASKDHIYIADPLTDGDMTQFWGTLLDTPWVLHAGRQDIEVVYQTAGRMPKQVFDTQVAAALLGLPPQMGYASLVHELFGIELDKTHTRADWSRRPLTDALLHYAAEDVEHLLPAFEQLAEQLDGKGRLGWAREDSALLLDPALYDTHPELAVDRLKGARNLRGKRRAAAARLAAWRESEALRANRPRQWIARDNLLIDIAHRLPSTTAELGRIEGIPAGLVRRSGKRIIRELAASRSDGSGYSRPRAPDEAQKSLLKLMQKRVAECAGDLGLAAETIASKRDLSAVIISGERNPRLMTGWRRELIGEELLNLM
jgi:ribonuclease D